MINEKVFKVNNENNDKNLINEFEIVFINVLVFFFIVLSFLLYKDRFNV